MEFLLGIVLLVIFFVGFTRMDSNIVKIAKSVENIEEVVAKKATKKEK